MIVQVYSLLGQTEGESKAFFGGCKEESAAWNNPQKYLVVVGEGKRLSFSEIGNNPMSPPFCK